MDVSVSPAAAAGGAAAPSAARPAPVVTFAGDSASEDEAPERRPLLRKNHATAPARVRRPSSSSLSAPVLPEKRPASAWQIVKLVLWATGVVLTVLLLLLALRLGAVAGGGGSGGGGGGTSPGDPGVPAGPWFPPGHNLSTAPVAYDGRSLFIDGERVILICGAVHYPRSHESEWRGIMKAAKEGGLNCIETLVFWNLHEPSYREYDWRTGNRDLAGFLRTAQEEGLYVVLRLGPYICGEWNYGGIPAWLLSRKLFPDGVQFRTYNKAWMSESRTFMEAALAVARPFLRTERGGGPVVLLQIENEYGWLEDFNGEAGRKYADWCAATGREMVPELPWFMCAQDNREDVMNTCNGFYCDQWINGHRARHPHQPPIWTEAWSGWFQKWGEPKPVRPAEDLAFAVARWFAYGGAGINYYMYYGGTNFGRTAGGPLITSSYDYDAPIRETAHLPAVPKHAHLAALHRLVQAHAPALLWSPPASPKGEIVLLSAQGHGKEVYGNWLEVHVFGDPAEESQTGQVAFLSNIAADGQAEVEWRGVKVNLKAWSVVVLTRAAKGPWTVRYDSSDAKEKADKKPPPPAKRTPSAVFSAPEPVVGLPEGYPPDPRKPRSRTIRNAEQVRNTLDASDYQLHRLLYTPPAGERRGLRFEITLTGVAELGYVYVANGTCGGCSGGGNLACRCHVYGPAALARRQEGDDPVPVPPEPRPPSDVPADVGVLTCTVGLDNYGARLEEVAKGITGKVEVDGVDVGGMEWKVYAGLYGEAMQFYDPAKYPILAGAHANRTFNPWLPHRTPYIPGHPPAWFRLSFPPLPAKPADAPVFLDLSDMGKGFAWINGHPLGRYWNATSASSFAVPAQPLGERERLAWRAAHGYDLPPTPDAQAATKPGPACDYRGPFDPWKCARGRGQESQGLLYVPRAWVQGGAEVVLFEEVPAGLDPGSVRMQVGEGA
ncbi:glycosyl hydrolases family 35-domain-containing protein [Hyaloraphidium curvatum]|nr:glycosyl hydrolases family 35-domain-containing protein [Hyaloraphidium curvatum]